MTDFTPNTSEDPTWLKCALRFWRNELRLPRMQRQSRLPDDVVRRRLVELFLLEPPLTAEEADAEYAAAPESRLTDEDIDRIVKQVTERQRFGRERRTSE